MIMQYVVVGAIVLAAVGYCVRTVVRMGQGKVGCGGCQKGGCPSRGVKGLEE
jgi:hypothetical protein